MVTVDVLGVRIVRKSAGKRMKTGIDRYVDGLLEGLQTKEEVEVKVTYARRDHRGENGSLQNELINKWRNVKSLIGIGKRIVSDPQVDITHYTAPYHIIPADGSKLVVTIHDVAPVVVPDVYPWYVRRIFSKTIKGLSACGATFITNSEFTRQELCRIFDIKPARTHVIHLGVSARFFQDHYPSGQVELIRNKYGLPERYFVYMGALNRRKNLFRVVDAFEKISNNVDEDCHLVLIGRYDWGGQDLEQYLDGKPGIRSQVHFPGFVDDDELPCVIHMADALIYMSRYEGFGLPLLEAMACGTPVIASDTSSIPEIAGGCAKLIPPKDTEALSTAMAEIMAGDPAVTGRVVDGRRWARQFTWQKTVDKTLRLYYELCG